MENFGLILAVIVGISLGLIGGGGSILTMPILVYFMGMNPLVATTYSLFIVGLTSLIGGIIRAMNKKADIKTVFIFASPSIFVVYATRSWVIPLIPETIFSISNFHISKSFVTMVLFAIVMLAASFSMIKSGTKKETDHKSFIPEYNYPLILLTGVGVGLLTGLIGAGGGFLIIPSLVLLAKMPMKTAVGTSLLIIALNSLIGFSGDLINGILIDWRFLFSFVLLTITGMIIGLGLSKNIAGENLKKGFGWFVLIAGIYIIIKEITKTL